MSYYRVQRAEYSIRTRVAAPQEYVNRSKGHTHTHTPAENNTPDTHTHDKNNTPNPQTNTPHKHFTTLEGGATTVRATSHARVGGRAEVSVGGRLEVRRGLGRARVRRNM